MLSSPYARAASLPPSPTFQGHCRPTDPRGSSPTLPTPGVGNSMGKKGAFFSPSSLPTFLVLWL